VDKERHSSLRGKVTRSVGVITGDGEPSGYQATPAQERRDFLRREFVSSGRPVIVAVNVEREHTVCPGAGLKRRREIVVRHAELGQDV
jgi:hypothetical protein